MATSQPEQRGDQLQDEQVSAVVDFLVSWRFCPVATSSNPSRSCLEDAAKQLLAALPPQLPTPALSDEGVRKRLEQIVVNLETHCDADPERDRYGIDKDAGFLRTLASREQGGGARPERELTLRLADTYAVLDASIHRDEDGDPDEDWMEAVEGHFGGGFFSAMDFALTGGQGCLDDEEFDQRRRAALTKHHDCLNLAAAAPPAQEAEGLRERLEAEIKNLDNIHFLADQESIRQGADGNQLGEVEAKGIATTAKNARDRLRNLTPPSDSQGEQGRVDLGPEHMRVVDAPDGGLDVVPADPASTQVEGETCHGCDTWGPREPHPLGSQAGPYDKGRKPCQNCVAFVNEHRSCPQPEPGGDEDWPEVTLIRSKGNPDHINIFGGDPANASDRLLREAEFRRYLPATSQECSGLEEEIASGASVVGAMLKLERDRANKAEAALEQLASDLEAEAESFRREAQRCNPATNDWAHFEGSAEAKAAAAQLARKKAAELKGGGS